MRVLYLKLVNVAGLVVGSDLDIIEIDFTKCQNNIVSIQGENGRGKSVLLSSINPFSYVTSLDDRSTLNYIIIGREGYKEIHYQVGDDIYIIKHYYKPTKESHSVKSYIMKNGQELNENGNVRSFAALVETHLGVTEDMMRLIRLGTNVNSFISLPPSRRKEYIGKLIDEIDLYLKLYKGISEEIRVVKALSNANATNVYNCHITDIVLEEGELKGIAKDIKRLEAERDALVEKIGKTRAMMRDNDINELRRKQQDAATSMRELEQLESYIANMGLQNTTVEQLINARSDAVNERIDIQSKINSYKMSIDHTLKDIERIDVAIHKISSNNDIRGLQEGRASIQHEIANTRRIVREMRNPAITSAQMNQIVNQLNGFNRISTMIYTLGKKPLEIFLKLKYDGKSVDKFLREHQKRIQASISHDDVKKLLSQMFAEDDIITPACETEFNECPYYRFASTISEIRDRIEEETIDGETLRYVQVISNNVDSVLNEMDMMRKLPLPGMLREQLCEDHVIRRLAERMPLFDVSPYSEYLGLLVDRERYMSNIERLRRYEQQIEIYQQSGIDSQLQQTKELKERVDFYQRNIAVLNSDIQSVIARISTLDSQISILSRYNESVRYKKMFQSTVESTSKLLEPLESAEKELNETEWILRQTNEKIDRMREEHRILDSKIATYHRLVKEGADLDKKLNDLTLIQESASTKKGIPVIYMRRYLSKIQLMANRLLQVIYDGELKLDAFHITQDVFEVPFIKNGTRIPDVKYASQSEISLVTMALSFALMYQATGGYNVLLLDEMDAGLDDHNRSAFLKMVDEQMYALKAEQVFIISHNMSQMINLPMDCICLGKRQFKSSLQNVIYEAA